MEFRVARHTNKTEPLIRFYTEIFGVNVLGSFQNHDRYDDVFLGKSDLNWHLEFTRAIKKAEFELG